MINILFVCHGNICRSPMAEFIMKDLVKKANREKDFHIESAATSTEEIGNPVYPPARNMLARYNIGCAGHHARQMTRADYARFDLLIGMDNYNVMNMKRIAGGDPNGKISMLNAKPVSDPWYTDNFQETYDEVSAGCKELLQRLIN